MHQPTQPTHGYAHTILALPPSPLPPLPSEFEARDVTLRGDQEFEVPDGHRMLVSAGPDGTLRTLLQPLEAQPTWRWRYSLGPGGEVQLEMQEAVQGSSTASSCS